MEINQRIQMVDKIGDSINPNFMPNPTVIKVIGVGNGGCNAVNRMIEEGLEGVSFIAMNTDAQMLSRSKADIKVVLGEDVTGGLGAGTDPERGAEAARRDEKTIANIIEGANLVFVASGFGGGTGTGASPVISSIAKQSGALTIGVITKPFDMEGTLKMSRAEKGIEQMTASVDSLIVIPNENLNDMFEQDISFEDALRVVDDILRQAVQGISDIITQIGFGINVDFADVQTMIKHSNGRAHLGIGSGKGEKRLENATLHAFNNPLLDVENIRNAKGILANILCPKDFGLREYKEAMKIIQEYAAVDANIKIGVCQKEDMHDEIRVTIVATGFEHGNIVKEDVVKPNEELQNVTQEVEPVLPSKNEKPIDNDIAEAVNIVQNIKNSDSNNSNNNNFKTGYGNDVVMMNNRKEEHNNSNEDKGIAQNNYHDSRQQEIKRDNTINNMSIDDSSRTNNSINNNYAMNNEKLEREERLRPSMILEDDIRESQSLIKEEEYTDEADDDGYVKASTETTTHEKKNLFKLPYDVLSEDELSYHRKLGEIENRQIYDENDIDTPAFLRRPIETRK